MAEKKLILIVEDELELTKMMKMRLEASGYKVLTALDGWQGLEKAKQDFYRSTSLAVTGGALLYSNVALEGPRRGAPPFGPRHSPLPVF